MDTSEVVFLTGPTTESASRDRPGSSISVVLDSGVMVDRPLIAAHAAAANSARTAAGVR